MRPKKFVFFPLFALAALLLGGLLVMLLWNAILPGVTSAGLLSYWQAVGLLLLSRILFGNWGGKPGDGNPQKNWQNKRAWREKWRNMSEEERAQLKEKWRKRCSDRKEDDGDL